MDADKLKTIIDLHKKWLNDDSDGVRADLTRANLTDADLYGANNIPGNAIATTVIVPDGDIIGWKVCRDNVIVKLLIPSDARRSNATGRKCRAEFVKVLEVIGADIAIGSYNDKTEYRVGEIVRADSWDENRWNECSHGIHFFITRWEAEHYQ